MDVEGRLGLVARSVLVVESFRVSDFEGRAHSKGYLREVRLSDETIGQPDSTQGRYKGELKKKLAKEQQVRGYESSQQQRTPHSQGSKSLEVCNLATSATSIWGT